MKRNICVILCTYNGERYLRPQIDSILSRHLPAGSASEAPALTLHVFDDCSTDGTRAILEEYRQAEPGRVCLHLREQPSGGACRSFLDAIRNVPDADLYILSDQDDIWDDDKVASLLSVFSGNAAFEPAEPPVLAFSDARVISVAREKLKSEAKDGHESKHDSSSDIECGSDGKTCVAHGHEFDAADETVTDDAAMTSSATSATYAGTDALSPDNVDIISGSFVRFQKLSPWRTALNQLLVMNQVTGAACMFNRSLRELLISVPAPAHAVMHDHFIALTASAFGRIIYLDKPLYSYRQHGGNVLGAQRGGMMLEVKKRLGLAGRSKSEMDAASRGSYDALFAQAEEFLELYGHRLTDGQRKMLRAFVSLRDLPHICRIAVILRYGFTFNRLYRTIGELLYL